MASTAGQASTGNGARSFPSCVCDRNPRQFRHWPGFEGGKVLIGIQLYGNPGLGTGLGTIGAQHPAPSAYAHALPQRDLRWHGEGQLHCCALGQLRLGVEEESTRAHVLGEPRDSLAVDMNRQWKMYLEALARATLNSDGVCVHSSSFPERESREPRSTTLYRFEGDGKLQIGGLDWPGENGNVM